MFQCLYLWLDVYIDCMVHQPSPSFQFILELCCTHLDENVIMPHLERIRAPAALSPSPAPTVVNYIWCSESHTALPFCQCKPFVGFYSKQKLHTLHAPRHIATLQPPQVKLESDYRIKHHNSFEYIPWYRWYSYYIKYLKVGWGGYLVCERKKNFNNVDDC